MNTPATIPANVLTYWRGTVGNPVAFRQLWGGSDWSAYPGNGASADDVAAVQYLGLLPAPSSGSIAGISPVVLIAAAVALWLFLKKD